MEAVLNADDWHVVDRHDTVTGPSSSSSSSSSSSVSEEHSEVSEGAMCSSDDCTGSEDDEDDDTCSAPSTPTHTASSCPPSPRDVEGHSSQPVGLVYAVLARGQLHAQFRDSSVVPGHVAGGSSGDARFSPVCVSEGTEIDPLTAVYLKCSLSEESLDVYDK